MKQDSDLMWSCWKKLFLGVLDNHASLQHKRSKCFKVPWLSKNVKDLIYERDKLKRTGIITKTTADWQKYKLARNKVNMSMRQAEVSFYRDTIADQKNDPKGAWKTMNNLLGKTPNNTVVNELKLNEVNLTSPEEIAEGFNDYFSNIGPKLAQSIGNFNFEDYIKQTNSEFSFFKTVENSKVHKPLLVLSISKAIGVEKISGKILKIAASAISPSVTHICNYAIINSSFPSDGKL